MCTVDVVLNTMKVVLAAKAIGGWSLAFHVTMYFSVQCKYIFSSHIMATEYVIFMPKTLCFYKHAILRPFDQ